jgi:hypothetical protein
LSDDEASAAHAAVEAHDDFIEHIELGNRRVRILAVFGGTAAFLLLVGLLSQVILPYASGTGTVTVNLVDPGLVALELVLAAMAAAWFIWNITEYRFTSRMNREIRRARELEKKMGEKLAPEG